MIRLHKGAPPAILIKKAAKWTKEYQDALPVAQAAGKEVEKKIRFRYRHEDIKDALKRDSHGKCVYCEARVEFGETDHINPVSRCPAEIVKWENLALVCKECNTHKSNYYDPELPLLNPYVDEPTDHLLFIGALVLHVVGSSRGEATQRQLKLNRADLLQQRADRLLQLVPLIERWATTTGPLKEVLRQAILDQADASKEFAATVRAYLCHTQNWLCPPPITPSQVPVPLPQ